MNEQHFDALPPVHVDSSTDTTGLTQGGEIAANQQEQPGTSMPGQVASSPHTPVPSQGPAASEPPPQASPATPALGTPAIADDIDLIEKEWVHKAKQIVEQTKHDPYQQNQEMTKMKADYLKKRYNRDIKVGDS